MALPGRTDATLIGGVIEVDEGDLLDPFISAANELVTEACGDAGYSVDRLLMIETWLAAHFYSILRPRETGVRTGPVDVRYEQGMRQNQELGLKYTKYGQQAMILDTAGGLATIDNRIQRGGGKLGVFWLGTSFDETETDVVE